MSTRRIDDPGVHGGLPSGLVTRHHLLRWARDPARTASELAAVCGRFVEVDRAVAAHPNSDSESLAGLSHSSDKATRARVTANPATPVADYLRLGQQFPKEFLANPVLDLLMLENPALLHEAPASLLLRLLKSDRCPEQFLEWAASHPQEKVQLAVAMNPAAPQAALLQLGGSVHVAVREVAGVRTAHPSGALEDADRSFREAVRQRIAGLPVRADRTLTHPAD